MKNTIFFDFFGVICSEISPIWFGKHFDDENANKIKSEIVSLGDIGVIGEQEVYEKISKKLNIEPEQIAQEWQDLVNINEELLPVIEKLKENYSVYLLSNAIAPFLERILDKYDLTRLFDKIYISSKIKIAKPSYEFYKYVLNDLQLDPQKAIMIDDNPNNIKSACDCGIDGVVFSTNEDLSLALDHYLNNN